MFQTSHLIPLLNPLQAYFTLLGTQILSQATVELSLMHYQGNSTRHLYYLAVAADSFLFFIVLFMSSSLFLL